MAALYTPRYTWSSAATADGQTYSLITDLGNGVSIVWATVTERTDKRFSRHSSWEMKSVAAGLTLDLPTFHTPTLGQAQEIIEDQFGIFRTRVNGALL